MTTLIGLSVASKNHEIENCLTNVFNESFQKGELSVSHRQCILSLLYKKSDPENLDNWCPISLLNIDYKILAHVLAKRLQNNLPKIISHDQQGFIKNRFIGLNIRQIQHIIDYTDLLNTEGILLFLDFKKAFDTVEWSFIFKALKKFGFKETFIRWPEVLYTNTTSIDLTTGHAPRYSLRHRPSSKLTFTIVSLDDIPDDLGPTYLNSELSFEQIRKIKAFVSDSYLETLKIT